MRRLGRARARACKSPLLQKETHPLAFAPELHSIAFVKAPILSSPALKLLSAGCAWEIYILSISSRRGLWEGERRVCARARRNNSRGSRDYNMLQRVFVSDCALIMRARASESMIRIPLAILDFPFCVVIYDNCLLVRRMGYLIEEKIL